MSDIDSFRYTDSRQGGCHLYHRLFLVPVWRCCQSFPPEVPLWCEWIMRCRSEWVALKRTREQWEAPWHPCHLKIQEANIYLYIHWVPSGKVFLEMNDMINWYADKSRKNRNYFARLAQIVVYCSLTACLNFAKKNTSATRCLPASVSIHSTAISDSPAWKERWRRGSAPSPTPTPALRLLLSPRCNIEIQLRQTALHAGWLPGSTVVNNRRVSVGWLPNQSCGCVHFNTLSGEFYGFLFWHFAVANSVGGESPKHQSSVIFPEWR